MLFGVAISIINIFLYKNKIGVLGVNIFTNKISMILSIIGVRKYYKSKRKLRLFLDDCNKFYNSMDKGVEYNTVTHQKILDRLEKKKNISIISKKKTRRKTLFVEKLMIGNTKGMFEREQFYKVRFTIKDEESLHM